MPPPLRLTSTTPRRLANPSQSAVPQAGVERVLWLAAVFLALSANTAFISDALQGRDPIQPSTWGFLAALLVGLVALHALLLGLVLGRRTLKPVLAITAVATALATFHMQRFGIVLDPGMLRNVLHTDAAEASELLSWSLALHLALFAGLPIALLWRLRLRPRSWQKALPARAATLAAALALLAVSVLAVYQPLSSLMRNHKALRYQVTPANLVWSLAAAVRQDAHAAARPLQPIGLDARPGPAWSTLKRPRVVVLVVGETARARNWGLNPQARDTTPELARLPVINFPQVTSCGTNTEVSVPCLFAPVGRRDHDEERIRGSESLLDVVQRAGVQVHWRDNQSGCKGVCDRVPHDSVQALNPAGLCEQGRCLDEGLLIGLDERLRRAEGVQLWVLHPLGNHGPSYFRRYPPAFAHFKPACQSDDLQQCSVEQIVNAYDNALRYTDHLLARLIERLQAAGDTVDSTLLYVSDHGESLGENGLFLHGLPYAIAPEDQKRVPMVMWSSPGFARGTGLDLDCLRRRAARPAAHDHVFHTLLGLLDVQTALYEPAWDLATGCRGPGRA